MFKTEISITNYSKKYHLEFKRLIEQHWKVNHPILNDELFFWQYKGFGFYSDYSLFKLLFINGRMEGFRGMIPGLYQIFLNKPKPVVLPGGSFAMWLVSPKFRGKGLGYRLMKEVESECNVLVSLGSNLKTSVPIYLKNNFNLLRALNRYVIPLDIEGYVKLLNFTLNDEEYSIVKRWYDTININSNCKIAFIAPDVKKLHEMWIESTEGINLFALYRNSDFWKWRYIESPGYKYYFFGDSLSVGIVVARFETVYAPKKDELNGLKVLRIIEIIPYNRNVWNGKRVQDIADLLSCVLNWGYRNGCCAADFQCSSTRLESVLTKVGFRKQDDQYKPNTCSLAGMFQPLVYQPSPINALWRVIYNSETKKLIPHDTYLVKSDNDMDRPNIIPVIDR